jgi:hypothetical protein
MMNKPGALTDTTQAQTSVLSCRSGCAACCIAPSINTPLPGMPNGKPAGVPCVQLTADLRCALFGRPERPAFCGGLQPSIEMCGESREYALRWIAQLETDTAPARATAPCRRLLVAPGDSKTG